MVEDDADFVRHLKAWTQNQPDDALLADSKELDRLIHLASRPAPADAVKVLVEALRLSSTDPNASAYMVERARAVLSDPRVIAAQSADPWCYDMSKAPDRTRILVAAESGAMYLAKWDPDCKWFYNGSGTIGAPRDGKFIAWTLPPFQPAAPALPQKEPG